jgi:hypothetical protein
MLSADGSFWHWLADAPAYTEVAVGLLYLLFLSPAVMAIIAWILTFVEDAAGPLWTNRSVLRSRLTSARLQSAYEKLRGVMVMPRTVERDGCRNGRAVEGRF